MTEQLRIAVPGTPTPQGSKIAGVSNNGTIYLREAAGARLYDWRDNVAWQASIQADQQGWEQATAAVEVSIVFFLPRPKTVKRHLPSVKPDLDKLVRSTFDGLTQSGAVWVDDSQACHLTVSKIYADDETPGAIIIVNPVGLIQTARNN